MRATLLLLFTAFMLATQAQTSVYHPFPDSNAVWNIYQEQYYISWQCTLSTSQYSYIINGDTVINGLKYHKLFTPFLEVDSCNGSYPWHLTGYQGCYRQDVSIRKVFFIPPADSIEHLLYDFNLQVGDTVKGYLVKNCTFYPPTVTSLDSIMINNNYRKRWTVGTNGYQIDIIEGIGSTFDLLSSLCYLLCDCDQILMCFTQNGIILYKDFSFCSAFGFCQCNIITSIEILKESTVSISPNPFHTSATLTTNKNKSKLRIYNTLGTMVREETITTPSTIINRNSLADGIYFYQLVSEDGEVVNGKFVVE